MIRSLFALTGLAVTASLLPAQPAKVLVIYNSHPSFVTDSLAVATHYQTRRNLPATPGRLCGISFPNSEQLTMDEWLATYRPQVRTCINTLGQANVLYIVMSYLTPFRIQGAARKYALDSHVADAFDAYSAIHQPAIPNANHSYYADAQSAGYLYPAFQTLETARSLPRARTIFSVWRLDGADKDSALGLIDRAVDTEAAGGLVPGGVPRGKVYGDGMLASPMSHSSDDAGTSGDFDLERMITMAATAGLPNFKDGIEPEMGPSHPSINEITDAMFFCGWYSLLNYNDIFKYLGAPGWMPGAIGWHLDSASATSPRSGNSWAAKALQRRITVTSGSVDEPYLHGLAHPDVVFRHLLQGGNVGDAFLRGTPWLKWMIMNVGDPLYRPFPGGRAPFNNPLYNDDTMSVSATQILTGSLTYTLTLGQPAATDTTVTWENGWHPYHVTKAPDTTVIPAGQRTTSVTITTTDPVPEGYIGVIGRAFYNGKLAQNSVVIPSMLSGLITANSATTIKAGTTLQAILVIAARAPSTGFPITLTSSHPSVLQVPSNLNVAFGAQAASFGMQAIAGSVSVPTNVTLTATSGPYRLVRIITVTP